MFSRNIPVLNSSGRVREYNQYPEELRDKVVYEHLFNGKTHRELDEKLLGLDSRQSKGFQSMGILHYIGIRGEYRGFFESLDLEEVIDRLKKENRNFENLTRILERLQQKNSFESELTGLVEEDLLSEKLEEEEYYFEGEVKTYFGKRYERNAENRKNAILIHGTSCAICEFNFEEFYGAHGRGFIEVHHINPISTFEEKRIVDPRTELIPVCPNCHRMLHRKKSEILSIEELRNLIKKEN